MNGSPSTIAIAPTLNFKATKSQETMDQESWHSGGRHCPFAEKLFTLFVVFMAVVFFKLIWDGAKHFLFIYIRTQLAYFQQVLAKKLFYM